MQFLNDGFIYSCTTILWGSEGFAQKILLEKPKQGHTTLSEMFSNTTFQLYTNISTFLGYL